MTSFLAKQRLRHAAEFDVVLQTGKRTSLSCFVLCVAQNTLSFPRIGIMVGKRYCRLAVKRNRIKRLVREYFRLHQSRLPAVDLVFLLRATVNEMPDQEQVTCIPALFEQYLASFDGGVSN